MPKHYLKEPMSTTLLGDPAIAVSYTTGLTSERKFGGRSYSTLGCLALHLDGERIQVDIPGVVPGLTEEAVREGLFRLAFVRVKFSGLVLEIKGGQYNAVTYSGTADRATLVQPPVQKA